MIDAIIAAKEWAVTVTGLDKDALHIHVSLIVLLGTALLTRRPLSSRVPWLAALCMALAGEVVDFSSAASGASWKRAALHDLLNTMLWPTILLALAKFTRVRFRSAHHLRAEDAALHRESISTWSISRRG